MLKVFCEFSLFLLSLRCFRPIQFLFQLRIQNELEKLQKADVDSVAYSEYDEKFQIFAWAMLILLLLEVCIFDKKNRLFRNVRLFK